MKLLIFFLLIAIMAACSPVRSRYFADNKPDEEQQAENTPEAEQQKYTERKSRFSDTTFVYLAALQDTPSPNIEKQFKEAVELFDQEKYGHVCGKFAQFAGTLPPGDSLYFEAKFYWSECKIINNELAFAKEILLEMIDEEMCPASVSERSIVRVGQIYCVLGKKDIAAEYFTRLRNEFPESIYLPLANCEAVGQ